MSKTTSAIYEKFKPRASGMVAVALALLCLIYIFRVNEVMRFQGGDNAYYILLAKAIAAGDGYRDTFSVGAPPHTQYPPVFPLMLAGIIVAHGVDIYLMKLLISISMAATIVFAYMIFRNMNYKYPLAAIALFALSYRTIKFTDEVLSEPVYMAFSYAALYCFDRWLAGSERKHLFAAILTAWAATMTRTAGVALIVAMPLAYLIHKKFDKSSFIRAVSLFFASIIPSIIWSARNKMVSSAATNYMWQLLATDPYDPSKGVASPLAIAKRLFNNAHTYFLDSAGLLHADFMKFPWFLLWMIALIFWGFVIAGFINRIKKGASVIEIYFILFMIMTLMWSFMEYRFLIPIYPLFYAYLLEGAGFGIDKIFGQKQLRLRIAKLILFILFSATLALNAARAFSYWKNTYDYLDSNKVRVAGGAYTAATWSGYGNMLRACQWLDLRGEPGALVMARKNTMVAFASGLPVIGVPMNPPPDPKKWLKENNVRYIVVDEAYPQATKFMAALTNNWAIRPGEDLKIVFSAGSTLLVEVNPSFFKR